MSSLGIRLADPRSAAAAVAGIYRPAVEETVASFEFEAPDAGEMGRRMKNVLARTPWPLRSRTSWRPRPAAGR